MGVVSMVSKGDWSATMKILNRLQQRTAYDDILEQCGKMGVEALRDATPKRTGLTSESWIYEIKRTSRNTTITWRNTNLTRDGDPIAILLQYGHGTGRGGYVAGRDYINPAMQPVFDNISNMVQNAILEILAT